MSDGEEYREEGEGKGKEADEKASIGTSIKEDELNGFTFDQASDSYKVSIAAK